MKDYSFNTDEYNELELFHLIKYDENIRFATKEKIENKIEQALQQIKHTNKDDNENSSTKYLYMTYARNQYIEKYHSYHDKGNIIPKRRTIV